MSKQALPVFKSLMIYNTCLKLMIIVSQFYRYGNRRHIHGLKYFAQGHMALIKDLYFSKQLDILGNTIKTRKRKKVV